MREKTPKERELAAAKRWASRLKGARSRPDMLRCEARIVAHLKALLTGKPADRVPEQGKLL